MKDKNMSVDDFYSRIRENAEITFEALLKEIRFLEMWSVIKQGKERIKARF